MLLTGAVLHSAVIITCIAARNARKSTVWLNLVVSSELLFPPAPLDSLKYSTVVIYTLSYSLLLFFGNQTGPSPPSNSAWCRPLSSMPFHGCKPSIFTSESGPERFELRRVTLCGLALTVQASLSLHRYISMVHNQHLADRES
jgi:hypothetical protein